MVFIFAAGFIYLPDLQCKTYLNSRGQVYNIMSFSLHVAYLFKKLQLLSIICF